MLSVHVAPATGEAFKRSLEAESVVIGRSSRCGLAIADSSLSREHARIFKTEDGWFVEDLGSRNGTYVKGEKISGAVALRSGDIITLGGSSITVEALSAHATAPTSGNMGGRSVFRPASDLLKAGTPGMRDLGRADQPLLKRYAERLRVLNEVHQALARSISLQDLLELILDRVFLHLQPEEGGIFLRSKSGAIERVACRSCRPGKEIRFASHTLAEEVVEKGHAALVQDALLDERFEKAESVLQAGVRSLVAAPLLDAEGALGMIVLCSRASVRQFDEEDMELLASLASVAALRIRNVALAGEAEKRRRLEDEIALARQIQEAVLPECLPELPGYGLYAASRPSRVVSGDLYQVLTRDEGRECVFLVADVSGKGLYAALLTASLEALCAGPIEAGWKPDQIFERVSTLLFRRTPPEKYATAFIAALELGTGRLRYVNAGHNRPLLLKGDGICELLESTGAPLGLLPNFPYGMNETVLAPGESLVIYTDGITEAADPAGEEYGEPRLKDLCRRHRDLKPGVLAKALDEDLEAFVQSVPFSDDRTVVILRRNDAGAEQGGGK
jgi:serine phosphatase RsbU (regulator of sigma subunit)